MLTPGKMHPHLATTCAFLQFKSIKQSSPLPRIKYFHMWTRTKKESNHHQYLFQSYFLTYQYPVHNFFSLLCNLLSLDDDEIFISLQVLSLHNYEQIHCNKLQISMSEDHSVEFQVIPF